MRRFEGRTVLVVGASSGIGLAAARRFAAEGATLIGTARNRGPLEQAIAGLPGAGHLALPFDASNESEVDNAAAELKGKGRTLDAAVLCAGQHSLRPLQLTKACHIDESLAANVRSALLCARMAARLSSPGGAAIVLLASAAAFTGNLGEAVYAASKGALIAACRGLAVELAPRRIRVNVVAPGVVETPMSDGWLRRLAAEQRDAARARHLFGFGRPDDVASALAFLAGDDARWITGACLTVDGGLTCH